jgi:uncharacterized membrane protein
MHDVLGEEWLRRAVALLVRLVESAGALIIFAGAAVAFARVVRATLSPRRAELFVTARLELGRVLALGLEFQLGSDLLRTAVAPTFKEIGELAAVAAIRTGLNYFLGKEIREERAEMAAGKPPIR